MTTIQQNLATICEQIALAAKQCSRDPDEITLVAVSKTKSTQQIQKAIDAGQRHFGENYVQEGVKKVDYFCTLPIDLEWHFIGSLQSNKTRPIAERFHWVHTIDRKKIAQRLSEQRPKEMPPLQILIQVNISQESTKSGITTEKMMALAKSVITLPNLSLRGLMVIPTLCHDFEQQLIIFQQAHILFSHLKDEITSVDTLSMGMSEDMQAAIMAGSTLVRIGSAIFGQRKNC